MWIGVLVRALTGMEAGDLPQTKRHEHVYRAILSAIAARASSRLISVGSSVALLSWSLTSMVTCELLARYIFISMGLVLSVAGLVLALCFPNGTRLRGVVLLGHAFLWGCIAWVGVAPSYMPAAVAIQAWALMIAARAGIAFFAY